jgi:hypothetical protein
MLAFLTHLCGHISRAALKGLQVYMRAQQVAFMRAEEQRHATQTQVAITWQQQQQQQQQYQCRQSPIR